MSRDVKEYEGQHAQRLVSMRPEHDLPISLSATAPTHAQRKISNCQTHDFNLNSKPQHAQRLISTSPKHDDKNISGDKHVSVQTEMGVSAVCGQGGGMVVSPAPTQKHHREPHTSRNVRSKFESGNDSEGVRGSNRPLDKGPLCSVSVEVSGIIGPPTL